MNLYEKHMISSNLIEFGPENKVLEPKIEDFSKKIKIMIWPVQKIRKGRFVGGKNSPAA